MTPEEFVEKVRRTIIEGNMALYRSSFVAAELEKGADEYGKKVLQVLSCLQGEPDREALLSIVRQVIVDTLSSLFGILDGSSQLDGRFEDFRLIREESGERLDGDLQDYLLSEEG